MTDQTNIHSSQVPTVRELRRIVKKRERERFSATWFLEPIQVYFSYVAIRLGLNSTMVTVLWLLVAFAGYAITAVGTPVTFIAGALLLYLKTILDGSDGEVARFRKQFVSAEDDLTSFIHGIYLDKVFHIIEKPLWGLSLAMGLYRMHGEPWIFAAGVSLAVFLGFCRHNATLQGDIPRQFAERVRKLRDAGAFSQFVDNEDQKDSILVRVADKAHLWMRNGKRFNMLVLLCGVFDTCALLSGKTGYAVLLLISATGVAVPFMLAYVIIKTVTTQTLIHRAIKISDG